MSLGSIIALASLFVTLGLAFIAGIWRLASIATRLETTSKIQTDNQTKLEVRMAVLDQFPVLASRVGTIEGAVATLTGLMTKYRDEFADVRVELAALNGRKISRSEMGAVRERLGSSPEIIPRTEPTLR